MVKGCVKTVISRWYKLFNDGVISSTGLVGKAVVSVGGGVKASFILKFVHYFYSQFYTSYKAIYNLLNGSFSHNPQPLLLLRKSKI